MSGGRRRGRQGIHALQIRIRVDGEKAKAVALVLDAGEVLAQRLIAMMRETGISNGLREIGYRDNGAPPGQ